jgi:hypothetical protein
MKLLRIIKIILLVIVIGGGLYLFLLKDEKNNGDIQNETSQEENQNQEETKRIGDDGAYNFKDEKIIVTVQLPEENAEYVDDVYAYGEEQIQNFISSRKEIETLSSASFPWNLDLDYKKYESDTIISYVVQGYEYTGGAHGNSFVTSFNFDKKTGKKIGIEDIVANENTFKALSNMANKELVVDYPEGADAEPDNWSVWYVDDTSITFVFMTYQIAAYVTGQQELKVDMGEENKDLFKKEYFNK